MTKRTLIFLSTLVFLIGGAKVSAQIDSLVMKAKPMKEVKGMAKNALRLGDTYTALFYFAEWANRKPDNISLAYQVAELYRTSRDYVEAEDWYDKVCEKHSEQYPLSRYYLAQMQMSLEKYEEAKNNFAEFKKKGAKKIKDPTYKKITRTSMMGCDYAIGLLDSIQTAAIDHLGESVNAAHIEFSPMIVDEKNIIYGSLKGDSIGYYDLKDHDSMNIPLRKFYKAKKSGDTWVADGEFQGPFNRDDKHVGNGVISEDGQRMYFTLCEKNWKGKTICELYYSDNANGEWLAPIKMNEMINMPNYTTTQPAIGKESRRNREVVYFVSDRPGGKGGMDIWYTEYDKKKDKFKTPKNAGSKINTPGTEFTPFYDIETHKLYFSSDGKIGIGGLDVYQADGEKSRWQPSVNMQKSINSSADDLDFVLTDDHKGGFLVSNRSGGVALLSETCCDDIYEFVFTEFVDIKLKTSVWYKRESLGNFSIKLHIKNNKDLAIAEEVGERFLTKEFKNVDEDFQLNLQQGYEYVIEVVKDGYLNGSTEISTVEIRESTELKAKVTLDKIPNRPTVLRGILYDFNSADLTTNAKAIIDTTLFKILIDNPDIIIQISSHTDNKGTNEYNSKLSNRRAKSVVNYLAQKGVNRKRLEYVGYGETVPIAANENKDGSDNPEGRKLNRRTEFEILGKIDLDDLDDEIQDKKPKKPKKKRDLEF